MPGTRCFRFIPVNKECTNRKTEAQLQLCRGAAYLRFNSLYTKIRNKIDIECSTQEEGCKRAI